MSSSGDFEAAKAFLQAQRAGDAGSSLYDHLTELLLKLMVEEPRDALRQFEQLSAEVKRARFAPSAGLDGDTFDQEAAATSAKRVLEAWATKNGKFFKMARGAPAGGEEGEEEEEEAVEVDAAAVQDLVSDSDVLEWLGVSVGRTAALRLFQSMRRLAAKEELTGVRFWGKVMGRERDYFVVESDLKEGDEEEDAKGAEGREGANKYTYWVCNAIGDAWVKLPTVKPGEIVAARHLRRFFTGRLDAAVAGHPPFPGSERNLLRAQIARITSSTLVCPEGWYQGNADEGPTVIEPPEEEPEPRAAEEQADLGAWVHFHAEVNVLGRCTAEEKGEEEEDEEGGGGDDGPEVVEVLRALDADEASEERPAWAVFTCPTAGGEASGAFAGVRSLRWPGATAAAFGRRLVNVYVGYGVKAADAAYTPLPPAPLQSEFVHDEYVEQEDRLAPPPAAEGEGDEEEED